MDEQVQHALEHDSIIDITTGDTAPPARCDSPAGAHGRKAESDLARPGQAAPKASGRAMVA